MAGFSAIQTYASDSEDDEAEYETHKIGETAEKLGGSDQPPRLPLPESILKFKGVPHHEEVVDNPADHEGRTRSFKHERGNWATHIFAKSIQCTGVDDSPKHLVESLNKVLAEYGLPAYYEEVSFHISLLSSIDNLKALLEPFENTFSEELAIKLAETPSGCRIMIECLYCKIGNKLYEFRLK
ncbi:U6 snRNA phosphodiesterase isoform X3 [Venturia canescens]|uniref:U6 snRNA phosphodiesterase isoform X3 n=1 Tax=Venturia canescens TaxID=32260 RepID=UPI001C9CFC54|nr:U6 snRNA phosphodiesterase isoform X3 [Venturia canescens]